MTKSCTYCVRMPIGMIKYSINLLFWLYLVSLHLPVLKMMLMYLWENWQTKESNWAISQLAKSCLPVIQEKLSKTASCCTHWPMNSVSDMQPKSFVLNTTERARCGTCICHTHNMICQPDKDIWNRCGKRARQTKTANSACDTITPHKHLTGLFPLQTAYKCLCFSIESGRIKNVGHIRRTSGHLNLTK